MMNLYRPELKRLRFLRWFDFRSWRLGMIAYILNRVTAIGLVVYLYLHLAVLSLLTQGPSGRSFESHAHPGSSHSM